MQISSAWSRGRFEVHCSTGVSPGTLFWDARSGRETSFTLPLPALPSPLSLLPLFSNGGETGHSFSRYKLADQRLHNLWVFPRWTKGNGWREREREGERFPRLHFVRISLETVPGSQIALVSPTLPVSSRKEKGTRERKLLLLCLLPRTISSSAVLSPDLCRGEIFSPVKRSLRNWPIEYSPRIRLSSLVKMFG